MLASHVSTIDISSTIKSPPSNSFVLTEGVFSRPFSPSKRWIVLAGRPVVSFIRLAARPVGAASRIGKISWVYFDGSNSRPFNSAKRLTIPLITVVFPVPGPPVKINRGERMASAIACSCEGPYCIPNIFSIRRIFFCTSFSG